MPVGGSNALKSKTLKPRGARNVRRPAPGSLDHATKTTTATLTHVRAGRVSSQSPPSPRKQLSVQVKIKFEEEGKPRRPRREKDEVQGNERRATEIRSATKEIRGEETACTKRIATEVKHKLDVDKEKSLFLTPPKCDFGDPDRKFEVRGRRQRVAGDKYIQEKTKERPKQVEITHGRRKRVTVRPVDRRTPTTAVEYFKLEKIISDLYDVKCALKRDEISKKAEFIHAVVEKEIIMKIHELDDRFTFDILGAGSYYEKLKVGKPNEFDIMVCLKGNDVNKCFEVQVCPIRRATPHLGGFAYLQYQSHRDRSQCWEDLLTDSPKGEGLVLSSHLIVELFRKLISRRCKKLTQNYKGQVKIEEPTIEGPAVNVRFMCYHEVINVDIVLSIEVPPWPSNARRWGADSRRWPSRKMIDEIKSKGCHVVPKATIMDSRYWRLSFSLAEKSLLRAQAIDDDKKCYRIIKHIYEVYKTPLEPLCSYFLKTLFLHLRTSAFFRSGRKISIIIRFFKELVSKIEKKKLQHFFIPDVNLFWNLTDTEARHLVLSLKRILLNFRNVQSAIKFFEWLMRRTSCE